MEPSIDQVQKICFKLQKPQRTCGVCGNDNGKLFAVKDTCSSVESQFNDVLAARSNDQMPCSGEKLWLK